MGDEQKTWRSSASGGVSASFVTQIYDADSLCVNHSIYSNVICDGQFPFSQPKYKILLSLTLRDHVISEPEDVTLDGFKTKFRNLRRV